MPCRAINSVADLHSKILDTPSSAIFFHFHAVFGMIWPNDNRPLGNPGSVACIVSINIGITEKSKSIFSFYAIYLYKEKKGILCKSN